MARTMVRGHRGVAAGMLVVGGFGVAAAIWVSGAGDWAIGALAIYVVLAALALCGLAVLVMWRPSCGLEERAPARLDRDTTAITGVVMSLAAIVGGIVQIARTGDPGVYGLFCVIGGVTYPVSLFELRRRR